jgi:hypothetical protein
VNSSQQGIKKRAPAKVENQEQQKTPPGAEPAFMHEHSMQQITEAHKVGPGEKW